MPSMLETEWKTWLEHRDDLVRQHEGKAVLIKGTQVIGVYETWKLAVAEGEKRFGGQAFFAHKISAVEEPMYLSAHADL